ncbi:MAG: DUF3662 domain-containing protein [Selenomonadaceae bacterium]|nr:DUF3662 domain-containing protein [Selenomonadaceae bacterium]
MKLANVIKGQIANLFQRRGEVKPDELIKALEREVAKQKTKENLVPNYYTIYLCEEDCHRLSAARLMKAMHEAVERKVIRENCFMDGALSIKIEKATAANEDAIVIAADYVDEPEQEEDTIDLENDVLSHTLLEDTAATDEDKTIVADHANIVKTMRTYLPRKIEYNLAVITDNTTSEVVFGERQIYLGRKETNDFVLSDESVSRIHAYVAYERHRHVIYDAGSLNGTTVNKKPISRHELKDGDKILIGSTMLTYKVL